MDKFTYEAFVLSGGKSSRMGTDKGLVVFQGKKMIEHVFLMLGPHLHNIISNNEAYKQFGYKVCPDIYKNCGPLGGIHSGLYNSHSDWNIVIGCDMPFVTMKFFLFLLKKIRTANCNAVVPVHEGKVEPLCALYHKSCIAVIEQQILKKQFRMQTLLENLKTAYIEVPKDQFDSEVLFRNMNTPVDISQ